MSDPAPVPVPVPVPAPPVPPVVPARPPLVARVVGTAIRVVAIMGILGAGWFLFLAYRAIFDERAGDGPPRPDARDVGELFPTAAGDVLVGAWIVGDEPWAVGSRPVAAERVEAVFAEAGREAPAGPRGELETDVLDWVRANLTRTDKAGSSEYAGTVGRVRVRVVVAGTGPGERLRLAQAGWSGEGGAWTVFEVVPRAAATGTPGLVQPLTPLPAGATVAASRLGPDGKVLAQLIRGARPDGIAGAWRAGGWAVEQTTAGPVGRSEGRTARAWSLASDDGPGLTLITLTASSTEGP